jgi:hypothetical protein
MLEDFSERNTVVADQFPGMDLSGFSHIDLTEKFVCIDYDGPRYVPVAGSNSEIGDLKMRRRISPPRVEEVSSWPEGNDDTVREQIALMSTRGR